MLFLQKSVHFEKIRWLFWLRGKMLLRSFQRTGRTSMIIGTVFLVLFGLPIIGGISIATFFAYRNLSAPLNTEILFLVLTGTYILWLVLPLMEFSVNEGLDLSKLRPFPLTRAELMISLIISTLLDIPTIGLFLLLAAVVVGWASSLPMVLLTLLAMLIFYIQIVGMSQLVLALLMSVLRSRRFRDLTILLAVLLSSSGYLCQLAIRGSGFLNFFENLKNAPYSPYLQWTPPGMAARAVEQASIGNYGISLVWLLALLILSVLVLYLWQVVVERSLSAPESEGGTRTRRKQVVQLQSTEAAGTQRSFLPQQIQALVVKDLKYFRRDPQLQALAVQSIISSAFLIFITLFNTGGVGRGFFGSWGVMLGPLYAFFPLFSLSYNMLGLERQGLTTLFLLPIAPKYILWGKDLLIAIFGFILMCAMVIALSVLTHAWQFTVPALGGGVAGLAVILGCGNFTSVFFPQRIRQMQRGVQSAANQTAQGGCLRGLLSLATFAAMLIILLPVAAALMWPALTHAGWLWTLSIPGSIIYGLGFYIIVTNIVAPKMLERAPEILEVVTRE